MWWLSATVIAVALTTALGLQILSCAVNTNVTSFCVGGGPFARLHSSFGALLASNLQAAAHLVLGKLVATSEALSDSLTDAEKCT